MAVFNLLTITHTPNLQPQSTSRLHQLPTSQQHFPRLHISRLHVASSLTYFRVQLGPNHSKSSVSPKLKPLDDVVWLSSSRCQAQVVFLNINIMKTRKRRNKRENKKGRESHMVATGRVFITVPHLILTKWEKKYYKKVPVTSSNYRKITIFLQHKHKVWPNSTLLVLLLILGWKMDVFIGRMFSH